MLIKLRTGTFNFTRDLVRILNLPIHYKTRCISCDKEIIEDITHMLVECHRYTTLRKKHFPNLDERLSSSINKDNFKKLFIITLLGGEQPTPGRKMDRQIIKSIKYLSDIFGVRQSIIASRTNF